MLLELDIIMPPRGFKTISIPEDVYNEISIFYQKEAGSLKKKGIKSLSGWIIAAIYEAKDEYDQKNHILRDEPVVIEDPNHIVSRQKILIIDDDEAVCETLAIILRDEGFDVDVARNGKTAIQKTKDGRYDLALVDLKLPDISFSDLLLKLGKNAPDTVKIVITGHSSLDSAIDALNLGAAGYISKPIRPEEVIEAVTKKLDAIRKNQLTAQKKIIKFLDKKLDEIGH